MSYPNPPDPTPFAPPPPPPPKKKVRPLWIVLAAVAGVFAICVLGSVIVVSGGGASENAASTADTGARSAGGGLPDDAGGTDGTDATEPSTSPSPTEPAGPKTEFGDGQWLVGRDIKPGTYRTAGPADNGMGMCYWAREKDASGEFDAIIANGDPTGPANVTVNKGEYFQTNGCQNWKLAG